MIILAPERNLVRNGSFTVTDFRLYDETISSKGRSPAVHIAQTSRVAMPKQNDSTPLPKQNDSTPCGLIQSILATPGGESQNMLARPARRRTR